MSCETFNQEMRARVPENQKWLFDFYDPAQMLEPEIGVIGAGVYRAALAYMHEETDENKPFALLDVGCNQAIQCFLYDDPACALYIGLDVIPEEYRYRARNTVHIQADARQWLKTPPGFLKAYSLVIVGAGVPDELYKLVRGMATVFWWYPGV